MKKIIGKKVLGLTGGFGSGKSTVGGFLKDLGAHVIDTDLLAHEALGPHAPTYGKVRALFKAVGVVGNEGLDRKKIAEIVFRDPDKKKKLEAVIHPFVFERVLEEAGSAKAAVVVLEVPLLFEAGFHELCHTTLVVDAPDAVIDGRLKMKGFTQAQIEARRRAQMPREEKKKRADHVIDNSKSLKDTRLEIRKIWNRLKV